MEILQCIPNSRRNDVDTSGVAPFDAMPTKSGTGLGLNLTLASPAKVPLSNWG